MSSVSNRLILTLCSALIAVPAMAQDAPPPAAPPPAVPPPAVPASVVPPAAASRPAVPPPGATSIPSQAAMADFQVVRRGDGEMTCDVLVAEINSLNSQVQAIQVQMTSMGAEMSRSSMAAVRRPGGGAAMGLAGMVAGFIPGGSMVSGAATMVAQGAAQAASQRAQQRVMDQTATLTENVTALAPLANRAAHLSEIARNKSC